MPEQLLSQRDIARHIGKAFSTVSGYVDQFPEYFPHNGADGLTRRYYQQALAAAEAISALKNDRLPTEQIRAMLAERFPQSGRSPIERSANNPIERSMDGVDGQSATSQQLPANPDSSTPSDSVTIERSPELTELPAVGSALAAERLLALSVQIDDQNLRLAGLEQRVANIEQLFAEAMREWEEYMAEFEKDLLERDRLLVGWVKGLVGQPVGQRGWLSTWLSKLLGNRR